MCQIGFKVPVTREGKTQEFVAYHSERRKNTFVVAGIDKRGDKAPILSIFTPNSRFQRFELPNFVVVRLDALYDGKGEDSLVHAVEVCVMWRGIEKFKAVYSMSDCESEIKFDRWRN